MLGANCQVPYDWAVVGSDSQLLGPSDVPRTHGARHGGGRELAPRPSPESARGSGL